MHRVASLLLLGAFGLLSSACRCGPPPAERCAFDDECLDDGAFCTGAPHCDLGVCVPSGSPCLLGEWCDELLDRCGSCADDPDHAECLSDGGLPDAAMTCEDRAPGTACSGGRCSGGFAECQIEDGFEWAASVREDGTEGRPLPLLLFPGGYCAASCDATRVNDECAPCAACNGDSRIGGLRLPLYYGSATYEPGDGVCRRTCTPSSTGTGCERPGYTCDLETATCMEACSDDRQCQIVFRDLDGDGVPELLDRGEDHAAYCDDRTGRCRTRGTPGARVGDGCDDDGDCEDDGVCLFAEGGARGMCSRLGCRAPGFECPEGSACDVRNAGWHQSACLPSCEVGAEDGTPAMLGTSGGHPDCGPGQACLWNGVAEATDSPAGSCAPGEYNAVRRSNIGQACTDSSECFSPFGYGTCLFGGRPELPSGICTVRSCGTFLDEDGEVAEGLLPGRPIADPICDPARAELCINLGARRFAPDTYCLSRCEDAGECPGGYACGELLSGGQRLCWPYCFDSSECRAGSRCQSPSGTECGPGDDACQCSG